MPGERLLDQRDRDDRDTQAGQLTQQASRERVGDPGRPLVHGVEGGRGYHDRIGGGEFVRLIRHPEPGPHPVAGEHSQLGSVDEPLAHRRGDDPDQPARVLGEPDELVHPRRGWGTAHDHIENAQRSIAHTHQPGA